MTEGSKALATAGKRGGWWWKIPLALLAAIVLVLAIVIWQLTPIVTAVANQQLPAQLRTDASVDQVEVKLWQGFAAVRGLRIAQPEGYGPDSLVELDRVEVYVDVGSALSRDPLVVKSVEVDGLRARLIKDADGIVNVQQLGPPADQAPADSEPVPTEEPLPSGGPAAPPLPGLRIDQASVKNVSIVYADASLTSGEAPFELTIGDLGLVLERLTAFDPALGAEPAVLTAHARIDQPDLPPARLDVQSRLGVIDMGVPDVNAQIVLTGLLLETLGKLAPAGAGAVIGGSGADVTASLALTAETINLDGEVVTDQGNKYPLNVKGPLTAPQFKTGPLFASIAGRIGFGVAKRSLAGATDAAWDLATGVTGEAGDVAKGAGELAKNIGGGLFGSAKSLLKGDVKGVGKGLKEATLDAAAEAAGDVKETTGDLAGVAGDTGDSVMGGERSQKWIDAIDDRHQQAKEAAAEALADMPWPPAEPDLPDGEPMEQRPAA